MITDKFSFEDLENFFNMAIIGKTNSGKTTLLKHILLSNKIFDYCYLIIGSETSFTNNEYDKYFYKSNTVVIDSADNSNDRYSIKSILDRIKQWSINNVKDNIKTLVVFDDLGKKCRFTENFTNECRHGNISTIFLIHDYKQLDNVTRSSLTHIVLTETTTNIDNILEENLRSKKDIPKYLTDIDNTIHKKKTQKKIYIIFNTSNQQCSYYTISDENYKKIDKSLHVLSTMSPIRDKLSQLYYSMGNTCSHQSI